jgi:hypothetical protein
MWGDRDSNIGPLGYRRWASTAAPGPHYAGSEEGVSGKFYPHEVQCEETATRTWDLSVTGGEPLPLHQARPSLIVLCLNNKNHRRVWHADKVRGPSRRFGSFGFFPRFRLFSHTPVRRRPVGQAFASPLDSLDTMRKSKTKFVSRNDCWCFCVKIPPLDFVLVSIIDFFPDKHMRLKFVRKTYAISLIFIKSRCYPSLAKKISKENQPIFFNLFLVDCHIEIIYHKIKKRWVH